MSKAECPICGCEEFYVKDPDDGYETYEFQCEDGKIFFAPETDQEKIPDIKDETETHCNHCSWHDKLEKLKK
jgi:hypothetical protein